MWRDAALVAGKDIRIEARSRVALWQVLPFAVLSLVLFAFALDSPQMLRVLDRTARFEATAIVGFNERRGPDLTGRQFPCVRPCPANSRLAPPCHPPASRPAPAPCPPSFAGPSSCARAATRATASLVHRRSSAGSNASP